MNEKSGLKLVLERNLFYWDQYKRSYLLLLILLIINVMLVVAIIYKVVTPEQPTYFAATATGRIIPQQPLNKPVWNDNYVMQWTADKVVAAFNIDYIHWRSQLQEASASFTQPGWYYFQKALKASNTLNTVVKGQRIASVEVTGAPKLINKMVIGGHYAWEIQLPLIVRYLKPDQADIRMAYNATVVVLRMPVDNYPQRIAINNFLPNIKS